MSIGRTGTAIVQDQPLHTRIEPKYNGQGFDHHVFAVSKINNTIIEIICQLAFNMCVEYIHYKILNVIITYKYTKFVKHEVMGWYRGLPIGDIFYGSNIETYLPIGYYRAVGMYTNPAYPKTDHDFALKN